MFYLILYLAWYKHFKHADENNLVWPVSLSIQGKLTDIFRVSFQTDILLLYKMFVFALCNKMLKWTSFHIVHAWNRACTVINDSAGDLNRFTLFGCAHYGYCPTSGCHWQSLGYKWLPYPDCTKPHWWAVEQRNTCL